MSREWRSYLDDILESCRRIRSYSAGLDKEAFLSDQLVLDAVLRNLEIIGEAAKRTPPEVRQQMSQIEWRKIAGMRDWLAHGYFRIDGNIVWDVVQNKLPELEQAVSSFPADGDA